MVKLQVTLEPAEADALARWAAHDLRDPREQLRYVLREALKQRGLLEPNARCGPEIELYVTRPPTRNIPDISGPPEEQ